MSSRGDPMLPLRWTCKSTWNLACGIDAARAYCQPCVGQSDAQNIWAYSLQANVKTREGGTHPDRDAQFRYNRRENRTAPQNGFAGRFRWTRRKKELVGPYKNGGADVQTQRETGRGRGKHPALVVSEMGAKEYPKAPQAPDLRRWAEAVMATG